MDDSENAGDLTCAACGHSLFRHARERPWPCALEGCDCAGFEIDRSRVEQPTPEQSAAFMAALDAAMAAAHVGVPVVIPALEPGVFTHAEKVARGGGDVGIRVGPFFGSKEEAEAWLHHRPGWPGAEPGGEPQG